MMIQPGEQICRIFAGPGAGTDLCDHTLADVDISHGRTDFGFGQAGTSTVKFTVAVRRGDLAYWPLGHVGNTIRVDTGPGQNSPWTVDYTNQFGPYTARSWERRFTGHITDIDYDWEQRSDGSWWLNHKVTCVGNTARLGSRLAAGDGRSSEAVRTRAQYLLGQGWGNTAGGETWTVQQGDYNPTLLEEPADEWDQGTPILQELEGLSSPGEALLYDTPDGQIVWQELAYRRTTPIVELDCAEVRFAPGFTERLDLINDFTIDYGPDAARAAVSATDNLSKTAQGVWAERASYPYQDQASAQTKATRVTRRQAWPSVVMPKVTVLLNQIDTPARWAQVRGLRVGSRVRLPRLPDPYPGDGVGLPQNGGVWIVEGWTEHVGSKWEPTAEWTLDLVLSPPIWSVVAMTWDQMKTTYPTKTWDQWKTSGETWDQIGAL